MTTIERWQGQLPSRLRGGEGSSTQVATQDSPDVECPEGLRHNLILASASPHHLHKMLTASLRA
ncbi:hypothetical protein LB505_006230 [Fusarium chuoi]|nr:hypothetical protein LB505_006230 [Fusarium chuoi]